MKTPLNITVEWLTEKVVGHTVTIDPLNRETYLFRCDFGKIHGFAQYVRSKKENTRCRTWVSTSSFPVEQAEVPPYILATVNHFLAK